MTKKAHDAWLNSPTDVGDGVVVDWEDGHQPRLKCAHTPTCASADMCFDRMMVKAGMLPRKLARELGHAWYM